MLSVYTKKCQLKVELDLLDCELSECITAVKKGMVRTTDSLLFQIEISEQNSLLCGEYKTIFSSFIEA